MTSGKRKINQPGGPCINTTVSVLGIEESWATYEYEDTVHIVLQGLYPGLVMALGFLFMKRPQSIGAIVKVPDHPPWV